MGGPATILYGGAEFSRDIDFAISISDANLAALRHALTDLEAERIFVPDLDAELLARGHACHFRCGASNVENFRIDVMHRMRGCADFDALWARRTRFDLPGLGIVDALSLPDLVQSKKTQRDKDWPMIRRLIEADYLKNRDSADEQSIRWWFAECRTPEFLLELIKQHPRLAESASERPWLTSGLSEDQVAENLLVEEGKIRQVDRAYWRPLREQLKQLRRDERRG